MSFLCTEGGNRTHTMLPSLDFESSASTNSATSAWYIDQNVTVQFTLFKLRWTSAIAFIASGNYGAQVYQFRPRPP